MLSRPFFWRSRITLLHVLQVQPFPSLSIVFGTMKRGRMLRKVLKNSVVDGAWLLATLLNCTFFLAARAFSGGVNDSDGDPVPVIEGSGSGMLWRAVSMVVTIPSQSRRYPRVPSREPERRRLVLSSRSQSFASPSCSFEPWRRDEDDGFA